MMKFTILTLSKRFGLLGSLLWGMSLPAQILAPAEKKQEQTQVFVKEAVSLTGLSQRLQQDYQISYQKGLLEANRLGLPLSIRNAMLTARLKGLDDFGRPYFVKTMDIVSARTTNTNAVWQGGSLGLSLSGQGLTNEVEGLTYSRLGMWEVFVQRNNHQEYNNRLQQGGW
ncbi:MAG: hypothetical protein HC913_13845 [Microscillaceae bacterium]|nr:hypothetical protein [Microscillaceae bacterium]